MRRLCYIIVLLLQLSAGIFVAMYGLLVFSEMPITEYALWSVPFIYAGVTTIFFAGDKLCDFIGFWRAFRKYKKGREENER